MRPNSRTGGVLIILLSLYVLSIEGSSEFPIIEGPYTQFQPAIYGDIVVWQDDRNGNWDVYGYNLSTRAKFSITTNPHDQMHPAIYGNIVVWQDDRNGNEDIYGCNLFTREEFQISRSYDQINPAIYGNIVVWQDDRNGNWDIYGYNLITEEEFTITTDQKVQEGPALSGSFVVWTDYRNENWDIYGYNLRTEELFQITTCPKTQKEPAIYGNIVVWQDDRNGNWDIYGSDLYKLNHEPEKEFPIATGEGNQEEPTIHKNIIVWIDERNGNKDIYECNLFVLEEFPITTSITDQSQPAVYENTVVWTDEKDGNKDIYGYILPPTLTEIPSDSDEFILKIWGENKEYFVGETLEIGWNASHSCEITLEVIEPDGTERKLVAEPIIYLKGGETDRASAGFKIKKNWVPSEKENCKYGDGVIIAEAISAGRLQRRVYTFSVFEDSDGDKVPDNRDECPDPDCDIVDEIGCPKDSDNDGVNDCKDECPEEFGENSNGCPVSLEDDHPEVYYTDASSPSFEEDGISLLSLLSIILNIITIALGTGLAWSRKEQLTVIFRKKQQTEESQKSIDQLHKLTKDSIGYKHDYEIKSDVEQREHLINRINKLCGYLYEYEDKFDTEDDPMRRDKYEKKIKRLSSQIQKLKQELDELNGKSKTNPTVSEDS